MTDKNQPQKITINDWHFRIKTSQQQDDQTKIMLLIHGYLGNENAMWILTRPLPKQYTLIAPRAPIEISPNQYAWHKMTPKWPDLKSYQNLTEQLLERVEVWLEDNGMDIEQYDVMGFSQGAVIAYALAFLHPEKIGKVAALASFIPQSWQSEIDQNAIQHKSFFIAHGTKDEIIPIQRAEKSARWLEQMGANVNFCAADIGHKLSADCFKGLGDYFK
jgi:phospholipase/carboxylesterase